MSVRFSDEEKLVTIKVTTVTFACSHKLLDGKKCQFQTYFDTLLPLIHEIWPAMSVRFSDEEKLVTIKVTTVTSACSHKLLDGKKCQFQTYFDTLLPLIHEVWPAMSVRFSDEEKLVTIKVTTVTFACSHKLLDGKKCQFQTYFDTLLPLIHEIWPAMSVRFSDEEKLVTIKVTTVTSACSHKLLDGKKCQFQTYFDTLLPLIHEIWPAMSVRFSDEEKLVTIKVTTVTSACSHKLLDGKKCQFQTYFDTLLPLIHEIWPAMSVRFSDEEKLVTIKVTTVTSACSHKLLDGKKCQFQTYFDTLLPLIHEIWPAMSVRFSDEEKLVTIKVTTVTSACSHKLLDGKKCQLQTYFDTLLPLIHEIWPAMSVRFSDEEKLVTIKVTTVTFACSHKLLDGKKCQFQTYFDTLLPLIHEIWPAMSVRFSDEEKLVTIKVTTVTSACSHKLLDGKKCQFQTYFDTLLPLIHEIWPAMSVRFSDEEKLVTIKVTTVTSACSHKLLDGKKCQFQTYFDTLLPLIHEIWPAMSVRFSDEEKLVTIKVTTVTSACSHKLLDGKKCQLQTYFDTLLPLIHEIWPAMSVRFSDEEKLVTIKVTTVTSACSHKLLDGKKCQFQTYFDTLLPLIHEIWPAMSVRFSDEEKLVTIKVTTVTSACSHKLLDGKKCQLQTYFDTLLPLIHEIWPAMGLRFSDEEKLVTIKVNTVTSPSSHKLLDGKMLVLISFAVTAKLTSVFVFATWIVQFLYFVNPKFQASSHRLCLYSPVCVGSVRKPHCWFSNEAAHII